MRYLVRERHPIGLGIGGMPLGHRPLPQPPVRTGPYTAVRELRLTHFDKEVETEDLKLALPPREPLLRGLAPGEMPGTRAPPAGNMRSSPDAPAFVDQVPHDGDVVFSTDATGRRNLQRTPSA